MKPKVKLVDIARALNISTTTVSKALNDKSDISAKTKKAVIELADKWDYRPNNLAISLRKNKQLNLIGVVLPNVDHYFFSTILKGIISKASTKNYLVMVGESNQDAEKEKLILEEFINYGINGALVAPAPESLYNNLKAIKDYRIPHILIDRTYEGFAGHYVKSDDYNGALKAVTHLIKQGYTKIAHVKISDNWSVGSDRLKGYEDALQNSGFTIRPDYIITCDLANKQEGLAIAAELLNMQDPPDAVFTVNDRVAAGILEYSQKNNISIPEDLGLVGFSNSLISSMVSPKLTTVEQRGEAMGELAFDYFFKSLTNKEAVYQKTFESKLIIRESSVRL